MYTSPASRAGSRLTGQRLLDIFFPRTCIECGRWINGEVGRFTCGRCRSRYPLIREPLCLRCGRPFAGRLVASALCATCRETPPRFARARSLFRYKQTGARAVHVLKYEHGTYLESEISALLRADARWRAYFEEALLIPVPLHPRKQRQRGYNQAEIVARAIQAAIPGVALSACLRRVRMTPSQTLLSRSERLQNMNGAFVVGRRLPEAANLIVVDDVLTTGATLNAAVEALETAGWEAISAFTLAHG